MSLLAPGSGVHGRANGRADTRAWGAPMRGSGGPAKARQLAEMESALRWLDSRDGGHGTMRWRRFKRGVVRRLNRLNAPVVYPWSPSRRGTEPAHALHRAAAELLSGQARGPMARIWHLFKACVWPLVAAGCAVPALLRCGPCVRSRHGQSLWAQARDLADAFWRHGIFPTEYYHHRVYRDEARFAKGHYLCEREMIALLSATARGGDALRVDQMPRFIAECRNAGLPVPRLAAAFSAGHIDLPGGGNGQAVLPEKDLFFRPQVWLPGERGYVWRWNAQARGWNCEGEVLGASALVQRCRSLAGARSFVLLEAVHNHPEMARFTTGGLCSVRVGTGMDARGEPIALFAAMHLPSVAEGGRLGGVLSAGIDLETGQLTPAWGEFMVDGEFDTHPGTGAPIAGATVPKWATVVDLALRAHRHFSDLPFVGWEIAVGGGGSVLLEASTNWGVFPHVLPAQTAFAGLCLERLEAQRRAAIGVHALTTPMRGASLSTADGWRAPGGATAGETTRG
jgi:hypothetical protein